MMPPTSVTAAMRSTRIESNVGRTRCLGMVNLSPTMLDAAPSDWLPRYNKCRNQYTNTCKGYSKQAANHNGISYKLWRERHHTSAKSKQGQHRKQRQAGTNFKNSFHNESPSQPIQPM